jgi:excisionase family DNA binding protein
MNHYIRPAQLAERLNVSEATLRDWIAAGRLPPPRRITERTLAWSDEELSAWFDALPTATASGATEP